MPTTSQETSTVAVVDSRPAAAFLLGSYSRTIKKWFDACTHWPIDYLGLHPALISNVNEMDVAGLDLRDEIEPAEYDDLRAAIRGVKDCAVDFDYDRAMQNWAVLSSEADRALPRFHPFFGWYVLGRVVGSYQQTLSDLVEGEQLPEFHTLQDTARQRVEEGSEKIPILQALVDLGEAVVAKPVYALHKVLGKEDFDETDEGSVYMAGLLLFHLHKLILEQLRTLLRRNEVKEKPIWDDKRSALLWCGKVIKEYRKNPAKNQVELIEAFHRASWDVWVSDPFARAGNTDPKTLSNTVYELNKTVQKDTIRFSCDGTGEGARWEPVCKPH